MISVCILSLPVLMILLAACSKDCTPKEYLSTVLGNLNQREVFEDYFKGSYPVLLNLDRDRIVREIIKGYSEGLTDERIRFSVNKLLKLNA